MARRLPAAPVAAGGATLRGAARSCVVCGSTERDLETVRQEYPQPPWWLCCDKDACRADTGEVARPL